MFTVIQTNPVMCDNYYTSKNCDNVGFVVSVGRNPSTEIIKVCNCGEIASLLTLQGTGFTTVINANDFYTNFNNPETFIGTCPVTDITNMLQYNFGKKVKIDKSGTWCFCDILNRGCEPIVGMFTNGKQIIVGVYTYPAEYNGFNVTHTYKNFK